MFKIVIYHLSVCCLANRAEKLNVLQFLAYVFWSSLFTALWMTIYKLSEYWRVWNFSAVTVVIILCYTTAVKVVSGQHQKTRVKFIQFKFLFFTGLSDHCCRVLGFQY